MSIDTQVLSPHADRLDRIFKDWEADRNFLGGWCVQLVHRTVREATLLVDTRNGKYKISGSFPKHRGSYFTPEETQDATISQDRTDEAIGKDAKRRVIDWYLQVLPEQVARMESAKQRERNFQAAMRDMAAFCNTTVPHDINSERLWVGREWGICEVRCDHKGEEFKIETAYLPTELAKKVIKLIRDAMPKQEE